MLDCAIIYVFYRVEFN